MPPHPQKESCNRAGGAHRREMHQRVVTLHRPHPAIHFQGAAHQSCRKGTAPCQSPSQEYPTAVAICQVLNQSICQAFPCCSCSTSPCMDTYTDGQLFPSPINPEENGRHLS